MIKNMKANNMDKEITFKNSRHVVKVMLSSGDSWTTSINGTMREVKNYYLGQSFEMSDEKSYKCIALQWISEATDGSGYPHFAINQ